MRRDIINLIRTLAVAVIAVIAFASYAGHESPVVIEGVAATTDANWQDMRFTDACLRGAVGDVQMITALTLNHDPSEVVGTVRGARTDIRGLVITAEVIRPDAADLVRRGALTGISLGFKDLESSVDADGVAVFERVRVHDVSLVSWPSDPRARVVRWWEE